MIQIALIALTAGSGSQISTYDISMSRLGQGSLMFLVTYRAHRWERYKLFKRKSNYPQIWNATSDKSTLCPQIVSKRWSLDTRGATVIISGHSRSLNDHVAHWTLEPSLVPGLVRSQVSKAFAAVCYFVFEGFLSTSLTLTALPTSTPASFTSSSSAASSLPSTASCLPPSSASSLS